MKRSKLESLKAGIIEIQCTYLLRSTSMSKEPVLIGATFAIAMNGIRGSRFEIHTVRGG